MLCPLRLLSDTWQRLSGLQAQHHHFPSIAHATKVRQSGSQARLLTRLLRILAGTWQHPCGPSSVFALSEHTAIINLCALLNVSGVTGSNPGVYFTTIMLACASFSSDGAVFDAEISTHLWAAVLGTVVILTGVVT